MKKFKVKKQKNKKFLFYFKNIRKMQIMSVFLNLFEKVQNGKINLSKSNFELAKELRSFKNIN